MIGQDDGRTDGPLHHEGINPAYLAGDAGHQAVLLAHGTGATGRARIILPDPGKRMKKKFKSLKALHERASRLQQTILFSTRRSEITAAFRELACIVTGKCICDLCPEWDKDVHIVYEFGRCIVPSRFLQMVKELHLRSKRWEYIRPLYKDLHDLVYADISPDTAEVFSNGDMENQACTFRMPKATLDRASAELRRR